MGSNGASSGNVGAAGRKTSGSYGTAKDARRTSRRNEPERQGGNNVVVQPSPPPAPVVPAPIPAPITPTVAEVSQSSTTDAEDPYSVRRRKTLAKGRSATIITSSRGVRRDDTLTLGKPSLLGA
ncbi:hypothetical protein Lederberg_22 [Pelagibacter phage Lederberg EXVC029P]|nr:hypothetical protein Lederberg_22 [Pelagibacter phage Lederberg EXVC029P]